MEDARDEGWGGVQELEMVLQDLEIGFPIRRRRPQDIVVVGKGGEEDAEEEARCWSHVSFYAPGCEGSESSRPMIRNVAKEFPLAIFAISEIEARGKDSKIPSVDNYSAQKRETRIFKMKSGTGEMLWWFANAWVG